MIALHGVWSRDSQLLRADDDHHDGEPELLHPWVVPAIGLEPAAALDVLLAHGIEMR